MKLKGGYILEIDANMTPRGMYYSGVLYKNEVEVANIGGWYSSKVWVIAWAKRQADELKKEAHRELANENH